MGSEPARRSQPLSEATWRAGCLIAVGVVLLAAVVLTCVVVASGLSASNCHGDACFGAPVRALFVSWLLAGDLLALSFGGLIAFGSGYLRWWMTASVVIAVAAGIGSLVWAFNSF